MKNILKEKVDGRISYTSDNEVGRAIAVQQQNNFLIDLKIVLIPGTQVDFMSKQNIDIKDKIAVARFLNLKL